MMTHGSAWLGRVSLIFLVFILAGCIKNPVTGGRQLALIGEGQEIEIGKASHPEILQEFGAVDNPALQEYFSRIGLEIARISHRPNLPWQFTVLDTDVVNAFAVPGGFVYFTRGILSYMNNEAELAGVLGHEIGHITARHSVTQMSQQQLLGLGLGLGSVLSPTFGRLSNLAGTGLGILMLKYSRDHERQSDQLGVQYSALAGYDPAQMGKFFEVFVTMRETEGDAIPNWLSSHPAPPDRIKATEDAAVRTKNEGPKREYRINSEEFLPRLAGLIYGENPREGFVDGRRFVHPDLRFQMDVPEGWKVQNSRSAVVLAEPQGNAVVKLTLVPKEEGQTPETIGQKIGSRQGVELVEGSSLSIHGNQAYLGRYRMQADQTSIGVLAAFVLYGGQVYQIAGLTPESAYSRASGLFNSVLRSFRELADPGILKVQPDRIRIYRCKGGESLRSIAGSTAKSRITLEDLSRLNRLDPDRTLAAGTIVKLVTLGR